MDKQTINTILGLFFVCIGAWFSIFSKSLSYKTVNIYSKILHIRFNEKIYRVAFLFIGIGFIIFGVLATLRIISFK